jgi:arylsulfatase A-like enzyme
MAARWARASVPLLLPMLLVACASAPEARPVGPNLLLLVLDTTRADRMSAYGYRSDTTPHLARLAREGVRFDQAVSHVTQTLPSLATLLSSRLPHRHGVRVNGLFRLPEDVVTLAFVLEEEGFATAAIVSAFPLDARFGLVRGFSHYDADFRDSILTRTRETAFRFQGRAYADFEQRADEATDKALAWLHRRSLAEGGEQAFFLLVHYFDPHWPYEPPEGFRDFADPYDGEIAFTDAQIGRLLQEMEAMGLLEDTLVVVTADHGELLDPERPRARHAGYLEEPVLRVPLLVRQPGAIPSRTVVREPVGLVDLAPTLLALLGVEAPEDFEGEDRSALVFGAPGDPEAIIPVESLYFPLETGRGPARFGARSASRTYVRNEFREEDGLRVVEELYDRRSDPEQRRNLLEHPEAEAAHADALEALRETAESLSAPGRQAPAVPLTKGLEMRLRALGYLQP